MDELREHETAAPLSRTPGTSPFAVGAGLVWFLCPGIGGPLGFLLGVLGLIQIRQSRGALGGGGMAKLGIVMGLMEAAALGGLYMYRQRLVAATPEAVHGFMEAAAASDLERGKPFMSGGLRPAMAHGRAEEVAKTLREALGEYTRLGERKSEKIPLAWPIRVEVSHVLEFGKGAPATGHFTLVEEYDLMRVRSFRIESPVLRPAVEVTGAVSQEVGEYSGPRETGRTLKTYRK